MIYNREYLEITHHEFSKRLNSKMEAMTTIEVMRLPGIYKTMYERFNNEILTEYEEEKALKTNYETELKNFKESILPVVTKIYTVNDDATISIVWRNWVATLHNNGAITEYQRENWKDPFKEK